jgi:hypothetical protein
MGLKAARSDRSTDLRRLTKHELDRRLELLVAEIALGGLGDEPVDRRLKPHRITPAELVWRMRKFIVYN